MRNYAKLLYQRVVLVTLSIVLQVLALAVVLARFSQYARWFAAVMGALSVIAVIFIVASRTDPSYKIAWIIPILVAPVFGLSFYLLFGGNRLSRRLKRKMRTVEQLQRDNLSQDGRVLSRLRALSPEAALQANYLAGTACCPAFENTETTYYACGEACFPAMLEALRGAKRYIFLEYFIIGRGSMWDEILDILRKKAAAGVDVRVIYDDFGCITTLPGGYYKKLESYGIRACAFNPYIPIMSSRLNNRDHRKFLIADGAVGFTGGINLADEYINRKERFGYWKDAVVRLRGEAVWSMTVMFLAMWAQIRGWREPVAALRPAAPPAAEEAEPRGFTQPFSDTPLDNEAVAETVFFNLITKARQYVWIMTPYLILSDKMISALTVAAKNGVDVRVVTPGVPDKRYVYSVTRAYYEDLCRAGVRVFEYSPGFIHSKVFCVDGEYAVVGTVNFDFRSLYLHFEDGVLLFRAACIADVEKDFRGTFPVCHEVSLAETRAVPFPVRLWRTFLRLFAPLM